jgi:pyrroloquinoline quinone (PQQ) biosynthesis protein C
MHRRTKKLKTQDTPAPEWAQKFWYDLVPLKDLIVHHPYFKEMEAGILSLERCRRGLINFYPLVENFPKYMALSLAKTTSRSSLGHLEARNWLIDNIYVEQRHADWWRDWAQGFGCTQEELDHANPSPAMDAINHYLWHINNQGALVDSLGATNVAVEWATGEWAKRVLPGVQSYAQQGLATINDRTLAWLQAHADYDDGHPREALELIILCARTLQEQQSAFRATKRGLEYYLLALDDCYEPRPHLAAV